MGMFFGTDGIRGVVNDGLTFDLAYKCGNAIGATKENPIIVVGGDTRQTRSFLASAIAGGAMAAGANVIDIGVCPTAGIAYITKNIKADFGVVISASHNPAEYNGIKIFDGNGIKLNEAKEESLEQRFINQVNKNWNDLGKYTQDFDLVQAYEDYLVECCQTDLSGLKIVLDCSNGASYKVAPNVFKRLGATIIEEYCDKDGEINYQCGSLYPQNICDLVKQHNADIGFAFDGDSDRVIACDENGTIVDGDVIIYILGNYLKTQGKLAKNIVVGTRHTNMGIEKALKDKGIRLIRTDIGDKYVIAKIEEDGLSLGGEKSGHIIFRELSTTGDGILTALKVAELVKSVNKSLSEISKVQLYPQINVDCVVKDKVRIINSEQLQREITAQEKFLGENSRIMVRVSGTEPKIRIMCESKNIKKCITATKCIEKTIEEINQLS